MFVILEEFPNLIFDSFPVSFSDELSPSDEELSFIALALDRVMTWGFGDVIRRLPFCRTPGDFALFIAALNTCAVSMGSVSFSSAYSLI